MERMDRRILKTGLIIWLALALLFAAFGFIVRDAWTDRSWTGTTVSRSAVTGVTRSGDTVTQGFDALCDTLTEIRLSMAPVGDHVSGTLHAVITANGQTLAETAANLSAAEADTIVLSFDDAALGRARDCLLTLTLTGSEADSLPALWYGTQVDTGRFAVDASDLDRLTVNGAAVRGRLCMVISGHVTSSVMTWYLIGAPVVLLLLLFVLFRAAAACISGKRNAIVYIIGLCEKYCFLVLQLVRRDFNTKYRQSLLGVLWSFLNPLMTMLVQYIVFSTIFRSSIPNFPVYLITGIVMFNYFSEAVSLGLTSIVMNGPLITKVYIPKYIFPMSRCISSLINLLISLVPMVLVALFTGIRLTTAMLLFPLPVLFVFCFSVGVAMILCTMHVFFRDTRFLWGVLVMLWNYLTPIFYPETIIPAAILPIYRMNPLYQYISFLRSIVIDGVTPAPETYLWCILTSLGALVIGGLIFRRNQDQFVFHL